MDSIQKEINLVYKLDNSTLEKIGRQVVEDYKDDLESRSEWEEQNVEFLKLFAGKRDSRSLPNLEFASNVCVPLLTTACIQFQARAYPALMPGQDLVQAWATDGKAGDVAKRVTKHLNWQMNEEIPNFRRGMNKLCVKLPIFGTGYKKTYWDFVKGRIESKLVSVGDLVLPYNVEYVNECERKTQIVELSPNEVAIREKIGLFANTEKLHKNKNGRVAGGSESITTDNKLKQLVREIDGVEKEKKGDDSNRIFLEQHRLLDLDDDGVGENYVVMVDEETESVVRIVSRDYKDPFLGEMTTWEYYTDYQFIQNPESHYAYGFGLLLRHLNETANTLFNELIDAGNFANMQSGFVSFRSGVKKGDLKFSRGELKVVDARTEDIKKDIYMFDWKSPSQTLMTLLGLVYNYSKELSGIAEAMTGKLPSSDSTATGYMTAVEQGLTVFTNIHKGLHESFKQELKKIFLLNRLYLKDNIYFAVQDSNSMEVQTLQSGRLDYINPIDVIPVSDPMMVSKNERVNKAGMVYQMIGNDSLLNQNPKARLEAIKGVLQANEVMNIQSYLPDPKGMEPIDYAPEEENSRFLQEVGSNVLPEQEHLVHLQSHNTFADSLFGGSLTPQGVKMLKKHIQDTFAALYLQQEQEKKELDKIALQKMVEDSWKFTGGQPFLRDAGKL